MNFIEFVGLTEVIEVRIGQCEDLVEQLTLGRCEIYQILNEIK